MYAGLFKLMDLSEFLSRVRRREEYGILSKTSV